ncbi:MAG: Smr/MutS family protein [Novosphingobium sp.]|nr:Smr/MutS family protein [Novosphingobium sp.]
MRPPRRLSDDEAALWARVARTVEPLPGRHIPVIADRPVSHAPLAKPRKKSPPKPPPQTRQLPPTASAQPQRPIGAHGLDAGWDRKLGRGIVQPDFTLDLHGCTLEAAHSRLDHGLMQAIAQGARVVLLITGKLRPSDDHAGRSERRGAIRSKFMDWLEAGPHAGRIAAVRPAHPRHGGAGAIYIVLKRPGR